jgi:predicted polyphosphate/ATP-dependent NAD kinase
MARPKKSEALELVPVETIQAVGMKQVGKLWVAYTLTIEDGQVVSAKYSEENLLPIVLDMARVMFVDEFMESGE